MKTLEEILMNGIKDADWTYCKAEYAPHKECKIGMPTEYTPDGTTKLNVKICYIVTAKFCDGSIVSSPDYMYLSDGRFYWYDNLWEDTDEVDQEMTDAIWNIPIAWIAYRNVIESNHPYPIAPYNKYANIPTPQRPTE